MLLTSTFAIQHILNGDGLAELKPATVTDHMQCIGPWRIDCTLPNGRTLTAATADSDTELIAEAMMDGFRLIDGETGEVLT
jgi:hypothetical protein